jgi:uncharacterized protein YecA (UPF0149 family)
VATKLTGDDLTGIADDALHGGDPRACITALVTAADEGRIEDETDVWYAFGLAADLAETYGTGDEAVELSARSVTAAHGTVHENTTRGRHADVLLRFGHEDDGMRLLHELRPLLTRDEMAAGYVIEALTENGRAELAQEWLTAALTTAADIVERTEPGSADEEEAGTVEHALALRRRHVRAELGLPADELDQAVDELDEPGPEMMFWPESGFDALLRAFPDRAETLGATWDEHRAQIEKAQQDEGPLVVEVATPELLRATLADQGVDDVEFGPLLEWPPGRNDPCWCGSGAKYKKCCLPRARP